MTEVMIRNCNNITQGSVTIEAQKINIKYAINGTGKSTVAKAIKAKVNEDDTALSNLRPYRIEASDTENQPQVEGTDEYRNVMMFDEEYVNKFVFQEDDLIQNSFDIFVKPPEYDERMAEIENLLVEVRNVFQSHKELNELITAMDNFIHSFGATEKLTRSSSLYKALGKGNIINNVPEGLEAYSEFLQQSEGGKNAKWLKWQLSGKDYLSTGEKCPYCTSDIAAKKEVITQLAENYKANIVEHINAILNVFDILKPYFTDAVKYNIKNIENNAGAMNKGTEEYLLRLRATVLEFQKALLNLKNISYDTLKNSGTDISQTLENYRVNITRFSDLNSENTREKVEAINAALNNLLERAGELQREINIQNSRLRRTVEENRTNVNNFLKCAGYNYEVDVVEEKNKYHLVLKPSGMDMALSSVKERLSYGERNAFALILFMFEVTKDKPDLIMLDDPISSFDGNKKFAIINMLFFGNPSLRGKTVLMLTHEFNTVIDLVYVMHRSLSSYIRAAFFSNKDNNLTEKVIERNSIKSFEEITRDNIAKNIDTLNKVVYLRRMLEIKGEKGAAWNMLSDLVHKRAECTMQEAGVSRSMSEAEKAGAIAEIRGYINDFDYRTEYEKTQDTGKMIEIYEACGNNYDKLQLYRIISEGRTNNDGFFEKYINEIYHVENDTVFQLDPSEYETIPQVIIDKCNEDVLSWGRQ